MRRRTASATTLLPVAATGRLIVNRPAPVMPPQGRRAAVDVITDVSR